MSHTEVISLAEFAKRKGTQKAAAQALEVDQSRISDHITQESPIYIEVLKGTSTDVNAYFHKPFGKYKKC